MALAFKLQYSVLVEAAVSSSGQFSGTVLNHLEVSWDFEQDPSIPTISWFEQCFLLALSWLRRHGYCRGCS
jgi:hypothetical protein